MNSLIVRLALRHAVSITFVVAALCLAGLYAADHMPSAVFPQTDFPRVIIMVENGVMPADEMTATITRPIEEAMKDIPGCLTIRSSTGRGEAEIDLFFSWNVDMQRTELYALGRLSQLRQELPATVVANVYRMTFSTFPIIGLSITGPAADPTVAWERARYDIKPKLLRIPGVARVDLVGGRAPEFTVEVDPRKLASLGLDLASVTGTMTRNNLVRPGGLHEEDDRLYLTVVDGRVHSAGEIEEMTVPGPAGPVPVKDFATVQRGPEPSYQAVTADGADAVLLNVYSQPDASTLDIAAQLKSQLPEFRGQLPPGMKLAFFYDQSLLVLSSVRGVWDAILFGLILSILILYLFLQSWRMTLVAVVVIPVTVLVTILVMRLCGMSYNLMTLGGIAAAIGLIIDDAIVVVEAIHAKSVAGASRAQIVHDAVTEILPPLLGSTLTPVVVFIPLAFLDGITGVFFRALAITMVVALLGSLVLAVTVTPSLASWLIRPEDGGDAQSASGGRLWRGIVGIYEAVLQSALRNRWFTVGLGLLVIAAAVVFYPRLQSDFLPKMDEGGFIIDYIAPPGSSLAETDRQMRQAEDILRAVPEVESYSRRTGAQLGVHITEPNTGDFLVKLKPNRQRTSAQVIDDVRNRFNAALPKTNWEFPGILTDLIGDLIWEDEPIEVKIFNPDLEALKRQADDVTQRLERVPGVVDPFDGLIFTGPTISFRVRPADAQRHGLSTDVIANALNIAMLGQTASTVMESDHVINIRVKADPASIQHLSDLRQLPLKTPDGSVVRLEDVADVTELPGQLELHRDDLRQDVAVTANLQNRDMGSAMADIQQVLAADKDLAPGAVELGGLYQQQQESFHDLVIVLAAALVLVFTVALVEFGSFYEPIAIVFGAAMSAFGIVAALLATGTTLNIVTFLGAIIGMGIVHKNGLLLLDYVVHLRRSGMDLFPAILESGRRRLRPVLMTSLAAGLGMLPLALGFGATDILRPMAIAVIGAVTVSVLLSLVATPTVYYLILKAHDAAMGLRRGRRFE